METPTPRDLYAGPTSTPTVELTPETRVLLPDEIAAIRVASAARAVGATSAPTPVEVPHFPPAFFGAQGRVSRLRSQALADVVRSLEDTLAAAKHLRNERHLDLFLERYLREVDRLDDALERFDAALNDPDGPRPPAPRALPRS